MAFTLALNNNWDIYIDENGNIATFDYCEPHTRDFNHELGEQNSQRI